MPQKVLKRKCRLKVQKSQKGMGLVEVMLAISILVIIVFGGSSLFAYSAGQISESKYSRVAVQLANQKLEQLRADNNISIEIPDGETKVNIPLGDVSYEQTTVTEDLGSYKKVEVTVRWTQMGKQRNVNMATLYVKR
jgi:prepilin-type N-terminal cleavage/methylation domain-containing protein